MKNKSYQIGIRAIHQKDIKTAILEAKNNGFKVLEIHFSSPQFLPEKYTQKALKEIRLFAEKNGIILQSHSEIHQSLIQIDSILRKAEKERVEKMIQFNRNIGARSLTLHPGAAPQFLAGPGKEIRNDDVYAKYYTELFEDSIKHIVSLKVTDLFVCIENADWNFTEKYQKILDRYLKTGKVFLTCDVMKTYIYTPTLNIKKDQWKFFKRNRRYVRNIHLSGKSHGGLSGFEKEYTKILSLFQNKDIPVILEILSLKEAIKSKKIFQKTLLKHER